MYKKARLSNKTRFSSEDINYLNNNPDSITEKILNGIKVAYSAEVSCIDRQIGIIISHLKRLNLLKKTVVILSTDHGELLGETKYIGHGKFLVDRLIHVPLIIYALDSGYFEGGKRISNLVEEVDIAPTILDICGIDSKKSVDGSSLLNIFDSKGWYKNSIYSEVVRDGKSFFSCFRTKEHKLIWNAANNEFSLYNIIHDPYEKENLINKLPEELAKIKNQFHNFLGYSNLYDLKPVIKPMIDKKMKEKLRALGYIK
jgi:arylsulfatase A-like enzyme